MPRKVSQSSNLLRWGELPSQLDPLGSSEMDCANAAPANSARRVINFMILVGLKEMG